MQNYLYFFIAYFIFYMLEKLNDILNYITFKKSMYFAQIIQREESMDRQALYNILYQIGIDFKSKIENQIKTSFKLSNANHKTSLPTFRNLSIDETSFWDVIFSCYKTQN